MKEILLLLLLDAETGEPNGFLVSIFSPRPGNKNEEII